MYTLAGPTFVISLFLDRLGVKKMRLACYFLPLAVSVSVSDSWFGKVYVIFFSIRGLFCWPVNQFGLCIKNFEPTQKIVAGVTPPTFPRMCVPTCVRI